MLASSNQVTKSCGGISGHANDCDRDKCEEISVRTSLPDSLWVTWCDGCGRISVNGISPHHFQGQLCPGTIRQHVYIRMGVEL